MLNEINALLELPIAIMMTVLFSASLLKKDKSKRQKALIFIIALTNFSLLCDICLQAEISKQENITAIKSLFALNYLILYIIVIFFHYFLLANISAKADVPKLLYYLPVLMAVILLVVYLTSYQNGIFFSINEYGEFVEDRLNYLRLLIRLSLLIIDILITVIYSKKLGFKNSVLMFTYEVVPIVFAFIDDKYRLSILNICISVLILIDYAVISVQQDVTLAKQKQYVAEKEKELLAEQTKIMISQIQPHFLYNVISSIMVCCKQDSNKAVNALADFSDYLRWNMHSIASEKPIPFKTELEHIKTYIRLEKLRFEDRLNMVYNIEDDDFFVPSLTIQPLVENAVKHGIAQKSSGGTVTLTTRKNDIGILITVSDDGVGFDTSLQNTTNYEKSEHIGISNVRSRLKALCNGTLTVISKVGKGTTVIVSIPKENLQIKEN